MYKKKRELRKYGFYQNEFQWQIAVADKFQNIIECDAKARGIFILVKLYEVNSIFSAVSSLRLVFTSDGVVVGVVIRRIERYDLVKIKPSESEAEH